MKPPAMITRAELSREIADTLDLPIAYAERVLETMIGAMVRGIRKDARIEIRGFGVFWIHQRAARLGRNPKTGEPVQVPPKKIVHFKPSKEIAAVLRSGDRTDALTEPMLRSAAAGE